MAYYANCNYRNLFFFSSIKKKKEILYSVFSAIMHVLHTMPVKYPSCKIVS